MNLIKLTLTTFLMTLLIACGGGSPDKDTETPSLGSEDTTTSEDGTTGGDDGTTGGTNLIEDIRFGSGSGDEFKNKSINFEKGYSLLGTTQFITVSVIDPNNDSSIVAQNYTYKFSSACADETPPKSSFLTDTIVNASGTAKVSYTNDSCLADTITVSLINPDGTEKAQIVSSVEVSVPKLGSGSGIGFVEGKISGNVSLIDTKSTILSLNAVDRHLSAINEKISSDDGENYIVKWESTCTDSTFTPSSQKLTSDIKTTYNASSCTADTVTASLYTEKDLTTAIDTANVAISIGSEAAIVETPALGAGIGASFKANQLALAAEYVLVGSRLDFTVNSVATDASNALTKNNYQYKFESSCAGDASFESEVVASSTGQVSNTYFNHNCTAVNTLTVSLFAADADVNADPALDTISVVVDAVEPKLGSGTGAAFLAGKITGEVNLVDVTSTILSLNVIDPSITAVNSAINSADYVVKWTSSCAASSFSVPEQTLTTGIETRYDANTCAPTDTVTASLYSRKDLATAIDTANVAISIGAEAVIVETPALGAGIGASFKANQLALAAEYVLVGSRLDFTVNSVATDASNALTKNNYQYKFESSCAGDASFASDVIASSTGQVSNTYFNHNCSAVNTLTVSLFAADADVNAATALDTINVVVDAVEPKLGSGTGAAFLAGKITGEVNLVDTTSTLLNLNVIDPSITAVNSAISSSDYVVKWTSSCAGSSFSVPEQTLTTGIETRYDANACAPTPATATATDTVTASLYSRKDLTNTAIATATATISISETLAETPVLGTGVGANFKTGELDLGAAYLLVGSRLEVTVQAVDSDADNAPTQNNYQYQFSATCTDSGTNSFASDVIISSAAEVTNTYFNHNCKGDNNLTVELFAVDDLARATVLTTATATLNVVMPKLGSGSGSTFEEGKISGEANLVDVTSTMLSMNAVNPVDVNSVISSADYLVKWESSCGSFSIDSQLLSTPQVETKYEASTCAGSDTVIARLYSSEDPTAEITSISVDIDVTVYNPVLGYDNSGTFELGSLDLELASLSAGGTSNVNVSIVDAGNANTVIIDKSYGVQFSSDCSSETTPLASFSAEDNLVITKKGQIQIAYKAEGCSGNDPITAKLYAVIAGAVDFSKVLATATSTFEVKDAEFGAIAFVSNSEDYLTFTGIANSLLQSTSEVTFKVTDNFGNSIKDADVTFTLSAGTASSTSSLSVSSGKTDENGEVSTTVNAGTSHGVLSVVATIEIEVPNPAFDSSIAVDSVSNPETITESRSTSSLPISVSTGIAVQSNFSLSADKFSVDAFYKDGEVVNITARLGDRYGNPVPAGTIVNFTAESGAVTPQCVVGGDGSCPAIWISQGTRSGNYPTNTAGTKNDEYLPEAPIANPPVFSVESGVKGFTTITAYSTGEAGFLDENANGVFDRVGTTDEPFEVYGEVYRDDNYDDAYEPNEEEFFEFVSDGSYTPKPTLPADQYYLGPLCNVAASNHGHCASNMYVTQSIRIVQSDGQSPYSASFYKKNGTGGFDQLTSADTFNVTTDGKLYVLVTDTNGNIPAAGVKISFAAEKYKAIEPRTVKAAERPYILEEGFPLNRGLLHSFTIREDTGAGPTDLEVTIPGGEGIVILKITN